MERREGISRARLEDEENVDPRAWKDKDPIFRPVFSASKKRRSVLAAELLVDEVDGVGTRKRILSEVLAEEMNGIRVAAEDKEACRSTGNGPLHDSRNVGLSKDRFGSRVLQPTFRRPITRGLIKSEGSSLTPKSPTDLQWPTNLRKKALSQALQRRQSLNPETSILPVATQRPEPFSPGGVEGGRIAMDQCRRTSLETIAD